MRSYLTILLLGLIFSFSTKAQQVLWASEVVSFSSELSPIHFSTQQVLGKPNVLPQVEVNLNSWTPGKAKKEHHITVGFEYASKIRQVAIAESYNVGALKEIIAIDSEGNEYSLHTLTPKKSLQKGRIFNLFVSETPYEVTQLRILFDGKMFDGLFYIDAIGISNSEIPIRSHVPLLNTVRKGLTIDALNNNINSPMSELRPLLSPDGKKLFFSRMDDNEDVYISEWNNESQSWGPAKNVGFPLNNDGANYVNSISPNGNGTLVILGGTYENRKKNVGLYVSSSSSEGWSNPVNLPLVGDGIASKDFDFTLSNDRKVIIIAVDGTDSYGDKDLYASFLQRTGVWSSPINLGSQVNTVNEEASPFLFKDGNTLYFSSRGFSGFGQSDIYVTNRLDDSWTNWTEPQNLGPDINSSYDDKYFHIPSTGNYAYMSRFIETGNADIFSIELPIFREDTLPLVANQKIESVDIIEAYNINFDSNKAMLLSESFNYLNEIIRLLKVNPTINLIISSHTDNVGNASDNLELSRLRASAIFDYLTQTGGIEGDRIELKWYGETQPVASNKTEDGRRKNRRVEFKVKP